MTAPRKSSRRGNITAKLVAVLLAVSLPPMLILGYYNLQRSLASVDELEKQNLQLLAVNTANRIDQLIIDTEHSVRILTADRAMRDFLAAGDTPDESLRANVDYKLRSIARVVPEFSNVYLMDREGVFRAASDPRAMGQSFFFRTYFQRALAGDFYVSELIYGIVSGVAGIYFSGPIKAEDGTILGVGVIKLSSSAVIRLLQDVDQKSRQLAAVLIDNQGVILHHPDPDMVFRSLGDLPRADRGKIIALKRYPVEAVENLGLDALKRTVLHSEGPGNSQFESPRSKQVQVIGFAPTHHHSWVVGIVEPRSSFTRPLTNLYRQALGSVALICILVLGLAVALGRRLTRPLLRLAGAAELVEQGKLQAASLGSSPRHALGIGDVARRGDEFGHLARAFEDMADKVYEREEHLESLVRDRTRELAQKNDLLEAANRRFHQELSIAHTLQLSILPTTLDYPDSWRDSAPLHATTIPAREVGGDFYDFFPIGERRLGLVVADVSGKGVPAAFFMAVARTVMRSVALRVSGPAKTLAKANDILCGTNPLDMFVTVFYGVLDLDSGRFSYANGGHNPPLLHRKAAAPEILPSTEDLALGAMADWAFQERSIDLHAGDRLFIYTDGITEAFGAEEEMFGLERLQDLVARSAELEPKALVDQVVAAVDAFTADDELFDDLTCLALCYSGKPAS